MRHHAWEHLWHCCLFKDICSEVYKGISSNHQYKCHTQVKMSAKQINVTADVYNAGVFLM